MTIHTTDFVFDRYDQGFLDKLNARIGFWQGRDYRVEVQYAHTSSGHSALLVVGK